MHRIERRTIEAAQTLQHLHDIADLLAERLRGLPRHQADDVLEQHLVDLAILSKRQEQKSGESDLASEVGFRMAAVVRTRVAAQLARSAES